MSSLAHTLPVGGADLGFHRGARRASQRFPLNADVRILTPRVSEGVVINASAGGLRVIVDESFHPGEELIASVVTGSRETQEYLRVVWSRPLSDGALVGLAFQKTRVRRP